MKKNGFLLTVGLLITVGCSKHAAEKSLPVFHLFATADYFPASILAEFEKRENCTVRYDHFANNEELLAKYQAGASGYDLIVPSDYIVTALKAGNFLQPIDQKKITRLGNVAPELRNIPVDPGLKFVVPYMWGTTGLAYRSDHITETVSSWKAMFEPRYKGHVSLLDDGREVLGAILKMQGHSMNTVNRTELDSAKKALIQLKPSVRLFTSDPKQHLLSGDVWLAHIFSGDAQQAIRSQPNIRYVVPKEGGTVWVDFMAIPKTAPQVELAHKFIDFILDPATAQKLVEELRYGSPNQAIASNLVEPPLRPDALRSIVQGKLEFLSDLGTHTELWDQAWTEVKSR